MAGKRIPMGSLKQVLLLRNLGTGKKTIARQTGVSKVAINEYLDVITRKGYVLRKGLVNYILRAPGALTYLCDQNPTHEQAGSQSPFGRDALPH